MSDLLEKCAVCSAFLDEEDLFCANCGAEAPHEGESPLVVGTQTLTHSFECQGCGASMNYDAQSQTLRCPFCGSGDVVDAEPVKSLRPETVVPFAIPREEAEQRLRNWLGKGIWRPTDLSTSAAVTNMTAVFVPYWIFRATTHTYWTADSSQTPFGAKGDWVPMTGEHRGRYDGLLVGASGVLTPGETQALGQYDLRPGRSPDQTDWEGVVVEQFRVQRKYARPQARQYLNALEMDACRKYVPGNCRNMQVNARLDGLVGTPVLLPVWIMAYRYKGEVYRFLLNGQSGAATGQAPTSWQKVLLVAGVALAGAVLLMLCAGGLAALSG